MDKKIVRRQKKKTMAPLFIIIAMIVLVVGIIATIFSFFVADDMKKNSGTSDMNLAPVKTSSTANPSSVASKPVTSSVPTSSAPAKPEKKSVVLPETKPVERKYFDDAVFVGDSISKGLKLYQVLPPANVIADQSVGLNQIANDVAVYTTPGGKKQTLMQALASLSFKPKKIYIMLGSNGLPHYENAEHIKYYYTVVDKVKKAYPDAKIILESVTPITAKAEATYKKKGKIFTNKKINEFNELIKKLAEEKGVYYINVREAVTDKNGALDAQYISPTGDGVHCLKSGHEAMYKYYKTHTYDGTPPDKEPPANASANTSSKKSAIKGE